ncbi:MAG: hypothetical protein MJ010_06505 [Paludibacteraceae bacterium]|nr:hypothetical protein [Paludibacteraceae bacterium]
MTSDELITYIEHPELLNKRTLPETKELAKQYPYFQSAALLYLMNLKATNDLLYQSELKRVALLVPDRSVLERILNAEPSSDSIYSLPDVDSKTTESAKLEQQELIDKFIETDPHIKPVDDSVSGDIGVKNNDDINVTDSIFTESLANIYIKQQQYSKAIRIFEKLNLKYPEKSSYFADRIENIRKLTENN